MFRKLSSPTVKQFSVLTLSVQSDERQRRLLRWTWPAFTVALAVFLRVRRAAQPAPIMVSSASPTVPPAVNTGSLNNPVPSHIGAFPPGEGPALAAAMGDVSPTTSDPNPAAYDATLPAPALEAEPPVHAELPNVPREISAGSIATLAPSLLADQLRPDDAAAPTPPLGPESFASGDLAPADASTVVTTVAAAPLPDVPTPTDLPSGEDTDTMTSSVSDDLTIIEGIGPKLAEVLGTAGITTFRQLAATTPEHLQQLIAQAGIRIGDPTTWAEQAALAASGNLQALRALQDTLKGGRRV
ncbi:MAG TPA: hypothetical protein VLA19_24360 [Herpetosiphonaceae bacterium]|nr:hypothetical protein [Herpetosiphonaceae bacterium]